MQILIERYMALARNEDQSVIVLLKIKGKTTLKRGKSNSGVSDDNISSIVNNIFSNESNPNGANGKNKNGKKSNSSILTKHEFNETNERNKGINLLFFFPFV